MSQVIIKRKNSVGGGFVVGSSGDGSSKVINNNTKALTDCKMRQRGK